jgi:hypothetical protein
MNKGGTRMKSLILGITLILALTASAKGTPPAYVDRPFLQDYSEKIPLASPAGDIKLRKVRMDRNGCISVLSNKGLLQIDTGMLKPDRRYRPLADMQIKDLEVTWDQFVYLTDRHILSNAWAGQFLSDYAMSGAKLLATGGRGEVIVIGAGRVVRFQVDEPVWEWQVDTARIKQAAFDAKGKRCLLLTEDGLWCLEPSRGTSILPASSVGVRPMKTENSHGQDARDTHGRDAHATEDASRHPNDPARPVLERKDLTCVTFSSDGGTLLVGTSNGLLRLDPNSFEPQSEPVTRLPCAEIRCLRPMGATLWAGTGRGAFALHADGRIDSYASRRWLVDDAVIDIWPGPDGSVLVLSETGLSIIHFREMTLADKAAHFEKLTRTRHIRNGFSSSLALSTPGDLATGTLIDSDNDGLWTAMYLAGELFRYAATKSREALRNCHESFEAMERLSLITPMQGFPARSFEWAGYQVADKSRWHLAEDKLWAWKGTTSSDEIVGHFFVYAIFAETMPSETWRKRAIALMDAIMDHIVRNNWYLVDLDGKPTQWGRWHPEYVNRFPRQVGDRKLNSAEIIAFLQTAHHFTGKDIYRQKAFELIDQHGYLDNILIPVQGLGRVPGIDLTTEWNHSDDELAFLSYWNLYRYAFTPELREQYRRAIRDHWEIERPEKNPLWNFLYAATGAEEFDLQESIWSLKEFPLDLVSWTVRNSHRRDLESLAPNFRHQSTKTVLPPDERPMSKYNSNALRLDGGSDGREEFSGDIYLLPYWLGRYLGVIQP